ncbi:MAG TPA: zinc ABC transporter substrate-binding protein [Chloroflexota bacterium]
MESRRRTWKSMRALLAAACAGWVAAFLLSAASPLPVPAQARVKVVATTGMIADAARNVGGEHVDVKGLMGPGVDPHLYKASQGDVRALAEADLILYHGLGLEGRMADILANMARTKPTVAVAESVPKELLIPAEGFGGHYDPHIWFDLSLWKIAVERVRDALIAVDPGRAAAYRANAAAYLQAIDETDAYVRSRIAEIPEASRVLVTAHDAFGYFGRAYGVEVVGLQGISTDTEVGLRDIQNLVDLLVSRRIKAVFVESSVPRRSLEAVVQGARSRGHTVTIGGELFSDALGAESTAAGTFLGAVRHNVDTIVAALGE